MERESPAPITHQPGAGADTRLLPSALSNPSTTHSSGGSTPDLPVAMEIQLIMSSKSNSGDAPVANMESSALHCAATTSQLLTHSHTNVS